MVSKCIYMDITTLSSGLFAVGEAGEMALASAGQF